VRLPVPDLEIKIVLSVSQRCSLLMARAVNRLQDNNQAARQQISPKASKRAHLLSCRNPIEKFGANVSRKNEIC
jgi:hypothetical protein